MKPVVSKFLAFDILQKAVCGQAHISDLYELLTAPPAPSTLLTWFHLNKCSNYDISPKKQRLEGVSGVSNSF